MKNFYEKFYIEINKLLSNSDTLSLEKIAKSLISENKKNKNRGRVNRARRGMYLRCRRC